MTRHTLLLLPVLMLNMAFASQETESDGDADHCAQASGEDVPASPSEQAPGDSHPQAIGDSGTSGEPTGSSQLEIGASASNRVLSLEQAQETLLERNYDLQLARHAVEQAGLLHDRAIGTLMPRLDLEGQYVLRDEEVLFSIPNSYTALLPYLESVYDSDPDLQQYFAEHPGEDARLLAQIEYEPSVIMRRHTFTASLALTQTLFNYRSFALLDLAEITDQQAANGLSQAQFQLTGVLNQMYFGTVTLKRLIEVSGRNVELSRLTYDRARLAFQEQVGNEFEVNRAEVALSRAQRDLENAALAYDLAIQGLALLLDLEPDFDVEMPQAREAPADYPSLVERALRNRPEVAGWDLAVEYGRRYIDENKAQWWPVLMANAILNAQQASAFGGDELSWMVIVTASWNLYDGGLRSVETENRELTLAQNELRRSQGLSRLESDIRQAWLSMESKQRQVESAREEAELARTNLELSETAWQLGSATELEVEYAREALYLSELALATSQVQLQAQIHELDRLAGGW